MQDKIQKIVAQKLIHANPRTKAQLDAFKRATAKEYKIPFPSNVELLLTLRQKQKPRGLASRLAGSAQRQDLWGGLIGLLRVRPVRSLSGIINVSALTKPYPCPGKCLYCPNEPGFPKSYLSGEPAAERAKRLEFDPYNQVFWRIKTLADEGHNIDKIELRLIGGTWSFYPKAYQEKFIAQCFSACNNYPNYKKLEANNLAKEQKKNENAKCRIVGISVETRPDYINEKEIIRLRKLGVTRVELGVQSVYDDVLDKNCRGHKINATISATKLLKDAGFKISYQIMLNLPGSSQEKDLAMAKILFSNPDFCPDLIKIYPLAILKEAPLYKLYKEGEFTPYPQNQLIAVIKEIKKIVPPWVRIERIIRDIPSPRIEGNKNEKDISNLRQIIAQDMEKENWQCSCIRCREIKGKYDSKEKIFLTRRDYSASSGKEIFLSFENKLKTKLFSLLRLRIPSIYAKPSFPALKGAAIIREIHTFGLQIPISQKNVSARLNGEARLLAAQHTGLGKKLIREAEKIAKNEFKLKKIAAISGIGARAYWRKNGYKLKDGYMVKNIR